MLDDEPLVFILLSHVKPIINDCSRQMKPFLIRLGVDVDELSPFCKDFHGLSDLLGEFTDFFSSSRVFRELF